ncbi:MAG TPA: efflux RND transporter periplasmic adaptor subunit [Burkholderiaceae bacterium]
MPESHHSPDAQERRQAVRRARTITVVVLIVLALGAGRTIMSRLSNANVLEARIAEATKLYVRTAYPKAAGKGQNLVLPATLQGFVQSPISARASGYLKTWHKDIGSRVAKGDLLAEIETPEIDQQLTQAIAAREQAASSLGLAKSTAERWEALRKRDAVSQQELDERRSSATQATANLAAADANVERLRQLEGFKRVLAPFSGVITRRNVDTGDLIDAGGGSGRTLFVLTQTDTLRVYVNVPQSYSQLVKAGQEVAITQSELPGQTFRGQVTRTAGSIDTATRTMQVEIVLPNRNNLLLPGAYVQVTLPLQAGNAITIPANALLVRGKGMSVAVVDASGTVSLRPIKVGRNFGDSMEALEGVTVKDQIVLNPPDSINAGDKVAVAPPEAAKKGGKEQASAEKTRAASSK